MTTEELKLTIEGFKVTLWVIGGCLAIISGIFSYYARMIHSDVRNNTREVGKNKGRCDQLQINLENEKKIREIELQHHQKNTQTAIQNLANSVSDLSKDIRILIKSSVEKGG